VVLKWIGCIHLFNKQRTTMFKVACTRLSTIASLIDAEFKDFFLALLWKVERFEVVDC
jgi:hypothetical protein